MTAIASSKSFFLEEEGDQGNMTAIHGLNGESFAVDLNINHLDKLFKRVYDLSEE